MADRTPAWREVYGRILDELIIRFTGYWAAKDWLDQIGDDPRREQYPEAWYQVLIPPFLRGKYDVPGWTANGCRGRGACRWTRSPPAGNLFFKGDFLLGTGFPPSMSLGDEKWNRLSTWCVTGAEHVLLDPHGDRRVPVLAVGQTAGGVHCENTKIWPLVNGSCGARSEPP